MTKKIKILILDDNANDVELVERQLKKSGIPFVSKSVQDKKSYTTALTDFKPDIILSDFSLPSFDGKTAFTIKERVSPEIPFIIVSGTIGEESAVELIKNGVHDYAQKNKLTSLPAKVTRALKDAAEKQAKKTADEKLKTQYKKLVEIASLQSHQVRAPIANILGLLNLIDFEKPNKPSNVEVLGRLRTTTEKFDSIIRDIVKKTSEIEDINLDFKKIDNY